MTFFRCRPRTALVMLVVAASVTGSLWADPPMRQRAVDFYSLRDGSRLLGVSVPAADGKLPETPQVLVNGIWLRQNLPELYDHLAQSDRPEAEQDTSVAARLARHVEQLRAAVPRDLERIGFLQERLTDLTAREEDREAFDLLVVEIAPALIRRQFLQKPAVQKIGGLALLNRVPDAENKTAAELKVSLQELAAASGLRTEIPSQDATADTAEFMRLMASAERSFGNQCRLISIGGRYIPADGDAVNLQQLLSQLLQGQISAQLGSLLEGVQKPVKATTQQPAADTLDAKAVAVAGDRRLVEVSRMELNAANGTAKVSIDLFFKAPGASSFQSITSVAGTAGANDVAPGKIEEIRNDPRVQQITQLFAAFGSGGGDLTQALGIGAAVEVAQNRAKSKLSEFFLNTPANSGTTPRVLRVKLTELPASRPVKD